MRRDTCEDDDTCMYAPPSLKLFAHSLELPHSLTFSHSLDSCLVTLRLDNGSVECVFLLLPPNEMSNAPPACSTSVQARVYSV